MSFFSLLLSLPSSRKQIFSPRRLRIRCLCLVGYCLRLCLRALLNLIDNEKLVKHRFYNKIAIKTNQKTLRCSATHTVKAKIAARYFFSMVVIKKFLENIANWLGAFHLYNSYFYFISLHLRLNNSEVRIVLLFRW